MSKRTLQRPILIGHRGAPGYRPEHTESAYRLAVAQGVDAVEPDVVATSDGVLVVRHENEISGTTDVADRPEFASRRTTKTVDGVKLTGWFTEDFTWAELRTLRSRERVPQLRPLNTRFDGQEPMLRLVDLLRLIDELSTQHGRDLKLVIELKHVQFYLDLGTDLVGLLRGELAEAGWADRREQLVIECFELAPLDRLRETGAAAQLVFLAESEGSPADEVAAHGQAARSFAWFRSDDGLQFLARRVQGISVAKRDLLRVNARGHAVGVQDLVQRAHARGLQVFTWTLRPENRFLVPGYRSGGELGAWGDWQAEWRLILSTGVDGVFLDHPDLLDQLLPRA